MMSQTPGWIDTIAELTAIRDAELLEFTLLKSLCSLIMPQQLALYKLDKTGDLLSECLYDQQRNEVCIKDVTLSDEYRQAFDFLASSQSREYKTRQKGRYLSVYYLFETHYFRIYLAIETQHMLSSVNVHLISGMLQIYRNYCGLLEESQCDRLTGLANRVTFESRISRICDVVSHGHKSRSERRERQDDPFWMAMVDIDHFKAINDKYGHLYGDEVLVLIAQTMQSVMRQNDLLFRFGGEEFVIIAQCTCESGARKAFERLRHAVEKRQFLQLGQLTISIGAVQISEGALPVTLLDYADKALYHSKALGRNRTTFFEDMLRDGSAQLADEIEPGSVEFF